MCVCVRVYLHRRERRLSKCVGVFTGLMGPPWHSVLVDQGLEGKCHQMSPGSGQGHGWGVPGGPHLQGAFGPCGLRPEMGACAASPRAPSLCFSGGPAEGAGQSPVVTRLLRKVFFRGITVNAVRGFPMSAAMFLGYELSLRALRGDHAVTGP